MAKKPCLQNARTKKKKPPQDQPVDKKKRKHLASVHKRKLQLGFQKENSASTFLSSATAALTEMNCNIEKTYIYFYL